MLVRDAAVWRLLLAFGLMAPTAAKAQNVFGLLGSGAEAKAHAGAGVLASRNAPANYYNPANLGVSAVNFDPYLSIDIISLSYTFQHPDYDAITITRTTPVPFIGWTYKITDAITVGSSLLPLPASSSSQKVVGLPTRAISSEPQIVDAETKGKGLGYRFSLGGAYKVIPSITAGLSILMDASGSVLTASDPESGTVVVEETKKTSSMAFILGTRAGLMQDRLQVGFTVRPPSSSKTTGDADFPTLNGNVDKSGKDKGPLGIGLATEFKVTPNIVPFIEINYDAWAALRSEEGFVGVEPATFDYYNTTDIVIGGEYRFGRQQISLGLGQYQSQLGDGIMKEESEDDEELIGMDFQDIDAMPYKVIAFGYKMAAKWGYLQTGFSYTTGHREVFDAARGYGTYDLRIVSLSGGGIYRF